MTIGGRMATGVKMNVSEMQMNYKVVYLFACDCVIVTVCYCHQKRDIKRQRNCIFKTLFIFSLHTYKLSLIKGFSSFGAS